MPENPNNNRNMNEYDIINKALDEWEENQKPHTQRPEAPKNKYHQKLMVLLLGAISLGLLAFYLANLIRWNG